MTIYKEVILGPVGGDSHLSGDTDVLLRVTHPIFNS